MDRNIKDAILKSTYHPYDDDDDIDDKHDKICNHLDKFFDIEKDFDEYEDHYASIVKELFEESE